MAIEFPRAVGEAVAVGLQFRKLVLSDQAAPSFEKLEQSNVE